MNFFKKNKKETSRVEDIRRQAECDYLTGLANRWGLYRYYDSLSKDMILHAMFIDIDNFKRVNDIYGHGMGDDLLVSVSRLIQRYANGFVSRVGGDEYVILFEGSKNQEDIIDIAEQMLENIQDMDFRKDILSLISLSIGIVLSQHVSQPMDDILYKCDSAMYQAKYGGKNRYVLYDANDRTMELNKRIEMEAEDALRDGQFKVYMQPKVNMVTSKLYGAEALSRWDHPEDGIRLPALYIQLFEKNGFITKLDMYMYEQVCKIKASWAGQKYEHIPVSVNMSRLHMYNKRFPDMLQGIAEKYGIETNEIELEIAESVFIKDSKELIDMVSLLRGRGFIVSIDNFGSGLSALSMLKDMYVDIVKIDKEFLHLSVDNARGKRVIRNVITLCKDLKLDVVVEGVEKKEQIKFMTSCGCQIAQGYYYSKPLPVDKFVEFADENFNSGFNDFTFRMNGNLKSEDGSKEASIIGKGLTYVQGIFSDSKAMSFPGGNSKENLIYIPTDTVVNDSFTISLWIKPRKLKRWVSAIFIRFENAFCSIMPKAWEGESGFRIKNEREVNGWYDVRGTALWEDRWSHYVVSYNAKTETSVAFINGEVIGELENVPTSRYAKIIMLGGDEYQPSFEGELAELVIYNEVKDYDFVKELHQSYVQDEKFIGFEVPKEE